MGGCCRRKKKRKCAKCKRRKGRRGGAFTQIYKDISHRHKAPAVKPPPGMYPKEIVVKDLSPEGLKKKKKYKYTYRRLLNPDGTVKRRGRKKKPKKQKPTRMDID